jgi:acetoin utilization protein AcuB
MLIRALMLPKEELVSVTPDDNLLCAIEKINERNFLSIPVVEGKKFVGVISKAKIYEEYFEIGGDKEKYLKETRVRALIKTDIPVLNEKEEIEKAAHTLEIYGVPFLAVVDEWNTFLGIITHYALFREFSEILGINRGQRISVFVNDIPGQVAKISDIITKHRSDIISFVVIDPKAMTEIKEISIRVRTDNFVQLVDDIRAAGYRVQ